MQVLINPRTKWVHHPACRWLAGTSVDATSLVEKDIETLPADHHTCSHCSPAVDPPATA